MRYRGFGQTQTRSAEDYEKRCAAGDSEACRIARSLRSQVTVAVPTETPEQIEARRVERERQAEAERLAIAARLQSVGLPESLAQAVKTAKDVVYAPTYEEGEAIIKAEQRRRWWAQNKDYVYGGVVSGLAVVAAIMFLT